MKTAELDAAALGQDAPQCAAHLARVQLETVLIAALPLLSGSVEAVRGEALHDFRVALRRLRSVLRGWKDRLPGALPRKQAQRLKKLSRRGGEVRDLELRIEALRQRREAVPEAALDALLDQLGAELRQGQHRFRKRLRRLGKAAAKLQKGLEAAGDPSGEAAATALRRLALEYWRALEGTLEIVPAIEEMRAPHRARIAAKRLRYLLEPLCRRYDSADTAVRQLTALQDGLGELHDRQLLRQALGEAAAERPQLRQLRQELDREAHASLERARKLLRLEQRRKLAQAVEAVLEDLDAAA